MHCGNLQEGLTIHCIVGFNLIDIFELGLVGYVTIRQVEKCKSQVSKENSMNKGLKALKEMGYSGNGVLGNGLRDSLVANSNIDWGAEHQEISLQGGVGPDS